MKKKSGFNAETVEIGKLKMSIFDVGGQDLIRPLWKHYYLNTDVVIFVVDSCDRERLGLAEEELQKMMAEPELNKAVLLVYANKQDLPNPMTSSELVKGLSLDRLNGIWRIQACSATNGNGIYEGIYSIPQMLKERDKRISHN